MNITFYGSDNLNKFKEYLNGIFSAFSLSFDDPSESSFAEQFSDLVNSTENLAKEELIVAFLFSGERAGRECFAGEGRVE